MFATIRALSPETCRCVNMSKDFPPHDPEARRVYGPYGYGVAMERIKFDRKHASELQ